MKLQNSACGCTKFHTSNSPRLFRTLAIVSSWAEYNQSERSGCRVPKIFSENRSRISLIRKPDFSRASSGVAVLNLKWVSAIFSRMPFGSTTFSAQSGSLCIGSKSALELSNEILFFQWKLTADFASSGS